MRFLFHSVWHILVQFPRCHDQLSSEQVSQSPENKTLNAIGFTEFVKLNDSVDYHDCICLHCVTFFPIRPKRKSVNFESFSDQRGEKLTSL